MSATDAILWENLVRRGRVFTGEWDPLTSQRRIITSEYTMVLATLISVPFEVPVACGTAADHKNEGEAIDQHWKKETEEEGKGQINQRYFT